MLSEMGSANRTSSCSARRRPARHLRRRVDLREPDIKAALTTVVLSANDPVAAWGGVASYASASAIEPSVVTGPATDNLVGVEMIREQLGVEASNAISSTAELGDRLISRLGSRNVSESRVVGE